MFKKILVLSFLSLLLFLTLVGCGKGENQPPANSGSNPPASDPVDPSAQTTDRYSKYLTISDLQEVTGMTGLTSKEELITLTFYDSENTNILEVRFYNSSFYEQEVGDNKHYTPVPDLGDQAAIAIPDMPYRVTFLQGEHSIMMQSIPVDGDVPLTEEQLIQLAKIVVSRL